MAEVTDLEMQIHALKQENSYAASVLAPIRCLPAEVLAESFLLVIQGHAKSPMDLMAMCHAWCSVVLGLPRSWSTIRLSTSTNPNSAKRNLFWGRRGQSCSM